MQGAKDESNRAELVAAASRLVARDGLAKVKVPDVEKEARQSKGAVLEHYGNLDRLFAAAYDRALERFCHDRERAVAMISDPAQQLGTAIRMALPSGPDDSEIKLLYELESIALREPACAELMARYVERQVAMYAAILEHGAVTASFRLVGDAPTIARNLVALEDGLGLYVVIGRDDPATVEHRIHEYLAAAIGVYPGRVTTTPKPRAHSRWS